MLLKQVMVYIALTLVFLKMNVSQLDLDVYEINSEKDYINFFKINNANNFNVLDLFCVCGGFSKVLKEKV